jgi:aminomethyltransferase
MADSDNAGTDLATTPLTRVHKELGARMVPFAGYEMPVQYSDGIVAEHLHTRAQAGLFDISHMGQAFLRPGTQDADAALETLVPGDIRALAPGAMRYTLLLNKTGGIVDDLMVTRMPAAQASGDDGPDVLFLVLNAARKAVDAAYIAAALGDSATLQEAPGRALIALQGPEAAKVLTRHAPGVADLGFMTAGHFDLMGTPALISRSGYTGEDGYEISVAGDAAETVFRGLLGESEVKPVGLGARDTLRLEAGLCLYGHDLDEQTTPTQARLGWTIGKRRREAADFPGAARILAERRDGPPQLRVGLRPEGKAPVREGARLIDPESGEDIGVVTSGGYAPSVGAPVAMGYVAPDHSAPETVVHALVRGKPRPCRVVKPPFVPRGSPSSG